MTKKSMSLSEERLPVLLSPVGKDYLWGGERLKREFGKQIDLTPLAETWECSVHPDGTSLAEGVPLDRLLKAHPEYIGTHPRNGDLPVLIKFIDAEKNLSVQVHPSDEYALAREGQYGKTEFWYIIDAAEDAKIIYGLHHEVDKDTLRHAIENGDVEKYLQAVPVKKDDVFYIPAGTIHAIGKGCVIAEIQQSSNLTYRLYDYNRVGLDGKKRELHIEKALDVACLKSSADPVQPMRVLRYVKGEASELLCRCKYFEIQRRLITGEVTYQSDELSFRVLMCIEGCGTVDCGAKLIQIKKGSTLFIPASSVKMKLSGKMQLLDVRG